MSNSSGNTGSSSSGYTLTIHVSNSFRGNGAIPHAFVTISGPDLPPVTVGYYPKVTGVSGEGTVRNDGASHIGLDPNVLEPHPFDQSLTFNVSAQQALNALNFAANTANSPGQYQLLGATNKDNVLMQDGHQCTGFARDVAIASGITPKSGTTNSGELFYPTGLGGTGVSIESTGIGSNPGALISEFKDLNSNQVQPFRSTPSAEDLSAARSSLYAGIAAKDPKDQAGINDRIAPIGTVNFADNGTEPTTANATSTTSATTASRPPSSTFVAPVDSTHVTLSKGGTVSDIVALQNRAGNPITADDVRAANPELNISAKFTNVRPGATLQVPVRVGDNLITTLPDGGTQSVNTKTNEVLTVVHNADGSTTQTTSSTDGEFTRTVRTVTWDKNEQVTSEERYSLNTLDNTTTPLNMDGTRVATNPSTVNTPAFTPDLTEDQANTLLTDLGFKPEAPSQPGIKLADASSATGTGTVSDAGTGGIGLGNTSTPNAAESNRPVALVEPEQPATNTVAPANTPTNPVDAGPDGSDAHFLHHPAPSIAAPLAEGLTLVNTLIGLKNWGSQSDLSHLSTAVNLYNQFDHLGPAFGGNGNNLPGNLGQFGAGISLITSLQSGNPIAVASSGASFANAMAGSNVIPIPVINILNIGNALQTGDPFAIASSVAACFPPWGTVASVVISIIGSLVPKDIPEPPNGAVHYTWDETGAITIQTDHDISDGAKTATSTAGSVLGLLQSMVTANNDDNDTKGQSSNNLAIDPSRMPRIGFTAGMSWLEITHADGSTTKETINPDTIGKRLLQIAVDNDALAPQWQIQTAQAHAKAAQAQAVQVQLEANAAHAQAVQDAEAFNANAADGQTHTVPLNPNASTNANTAADIDGHAPATPAPVQVNLHNTAAVFGTEGKVQETADHKTQTFAALVVHLHSPGAQDAVAAIATNTVLQDVDGDGFWEQTQWVASKDDAGNAQGMLVLDHNNNRLIEAADILHLGGNSNERNSLDWLDSNNDGKLDASDPAFAAIKVFVDINSNGQVDDGEMQTPQHSSIDFTTGQINYTEGPSASQCDVFIASHCPVTRQTCTRNGFRRRFPKSLSIKNAVSPRKTDACCYNVSSTG